MSNKLTRFTRAALLAVSVSLIAGCAATHTMIAKRNLDVQTKMSDTVFLEPVGASKKTIFVQFRNTSDKPDFSIESEILSGLKARGYTIMDEPEDAHYIMQAYILQVGKVSPTAAESALNVGYGNAGGAVTAAGVAYVAGVESGRGLVGAGIAGGATSLIANAMVKDVTYSAITDMQISERVGGTVTRKSQHQLKQGTSGSTSENYSDESNFKRYQTRIVSVANKANLKFEDALPELRKGLIHATVGMF
jgi:hypothetical protein